MKSEEQCMSKVKISRERNIKKYQTEIMELKNKISELKNSIEEFSSRLEHRKKDSMILKTGHLKLSSQTAKIMKKA